MGSTAMLVDHHAAGPRSAVAARRSLRTPPPLDHTRLDAPLSPAVLSSGTPLELLTCHRAPGRLPVLAKELVHHRSAGCDHWAQFVPVYRLGGSAVRVS